MRKRSVLIGFGALTAALAGAAYAQTGRSAALTQVAHFDHQVTGVAVTADGRRFVSFPRWTDDAPISVAEVMPNGSLWPYPDVKWNSWRNARANEMPVGEHFVCVQSIVPDGHGNLWVLDPGAPGADDHLDEAATEPVVDGRHDDRRGRADVDVEELAEGAVRAALLQLVSDVVAVERKDRVSRCFHTLQSTTR